MKKHAVKIVIIMVVVFSLVFLGDYVSSYASQVIDDELSYCYIYGDKKYTSPISESEAWYNAMKENYDEGLITEEEVYQNFLSRPNEGIEEEIITTDYNEYKGTADTTVYGTLTIEASKGEKIPLKNMKVAIWNDNKLISLPMMTTYTNEFGEYRFDFENADEVSDFENGGYDIYVRCYSDSYTFTIARDWFFSFLTHYFFDTSTIRNIKTGTTTMINLNITHDLANEWFQIFYMTQAFALAQNFALRMGMYVKNDILLNVIYPFKTVDTAFRYKIFSGIPDKDFTESNIDRVFDTVMHGYGHFVEGILGTYGSNLIEIALYNPNHWLGADHFSDKKNKRFAMELTWSEAWATTFAQMAQEYYIHEYLKKQEDGEEKIIIQGYDDYLDGNFNIQDYTPNYDSCEAQEIAVIASLWDMFDCDSDESHDELSLGYKDWWDITTKDQSQTLTDFVKVIDEHYPKYRNQIANILGHNQIAPSSFKIDNIDEVSIDVAPIFSWKVNGSTNNPNNLFKIVFINLVNEIIFEREIKNLDKSYDSIFKYESLSLKDWQLFYDTLNPGIVTFYTLVIGYNSDGTPISGPYYSNQKLLTLTKEGKHECIYNIYSKYSNSQHKISCECGKYILKPHSVKLSDIGRYKQCIICGAMVDTDTGIIEVDPFNNTNVLRTLNGSYILPNGIIVLVDEDIVSYLNGTLIFYNKEDEII